MMKTDAAQVPPKIDSLVITMGILVSIRLRENQGHGLMIPQSPGLQVHIAVKY